MAGTHEENLELFGDESFSDELLEHLGEIPDEDKAKWPQHLVALLDIFRTKLERMGYGDDDATKITYALLLELSSYCGGRHIYLAKQDVLVKTIRDINLYRDYRFHRMSPEALAAKYDLSLQHVYRVTKKQQQYHLKKIQPPLF